MADSDKRLGGQLNIFSSIGYHAFISSLEEGKVYNQIGWGHGRICYLQGLL